MTKISRALLQALRSCPLEELGFANCRQISTEAWQLLGLGCAWQLKKASFSRCGLVAFEALVFGGKKSWGIHFPPSEQGTKTSPLLFEKPPWAKKVFHSVFSPTSERRGHSSQQPGALTQIRRVLRALLRFWRSWPDVHYRMGGGWKQGTLCERRTSKC